MNLPDLRKRILAGEEIPVELIRQAIMYQAEQRKVALSLKKAKEVKEPREPKEPKKKAAKVTKQQQLDELFTTMNTNTDELP